LVRLAKEADWNVPDVYGEENLSFGTPRRRCVNKKIYLSQNRLRQMLVGAKFHSGYLWFKAWYNVC
jgi:hypothetical protein